MAFSVESRVPFLNIELAKLVLSLPEKYFLGNKFISKYLFRCAMEEIVPKQILSRKDKIGFATPERIWVRKLYKWVNEYLNDFLLISHLPLNVKKLNYYLTKNNKNQSFDMEVWRVINFLQWVKIYNIKF